MPAIKSVVFLTYHFPPEVGGIQTRISKYIDRLGRRGIHVTVLVAGREAKIKGATLDAKTILCPGGIRRLPESVVSVTNTVIGCRADVVHVFTGSSTLLGVYSLIIARVVGAKPVISLFGREDFELPGRASRTLLRMSTALADSIDVNSGSTRSFLSERVRAKAHVLFGAAEVTVATQSQAARSPPTVLFVGRLAARKGVDDLLHAFATVRVRFPEARLSVVGDGPEMRDLIKLAGRLGISDYVSFKGTLVGRALEQEYEGSTVFVLPSKDVASDTANEGLGLALIEASMHSNALIGTDYGGIPEIVRQGENGLLVPPADPDALAQAITTILADPDLARSMGQSALRIATERFSWDRATDTLLESYT
jgi:phosphatidylinositol alpha-1,6-mannosyltransferase